jgi:hypothetical protein
MFVLHSLLSLLTLAQRTWGKHEVLASDKFSRTSIIVIGDMCEVVFCRAFAISQPQGGEVTCYNFPHLILFSTCMIANLIP